MMLHHKHNYWSYVHAQSLSCVWLFVNPLDYSLPGSSVHGIFQARMMQWFAVPFSRGSSQPRDQTHISRVSCIDRWILYCWAPGEALLKLTWPVFYVETVLLLLLLSHFSRVRLCATQETAAHQAPPSLGFSRQEHWSGLPFPSPMHESEKWKWSRSVVSNFTTPWTAAYQPTPIHGIFQARVLEWGVIAFSERQC